MVTKEPTSGSSKSPSRLSDPSTIARKLGFVTLAVLMLILLGISLSSVPVSSGSATAIPSTDHMSGAPLSGASSIFLPIVSKSCPPPFSDPGEPNSPFPYLGPFPPGFLSYNMTDYYVDQRNFHCRPVTVAWEKKANVPDSRRLEVTEFIFSTFINWWNIFHGFYHPSYTVVHKTQSSNTGWESPIGYETIAADYTGEYHEWVSHGVFHAWVGAVLRNGQEQKVEDGMWFNEGITQYYGNRGTGVTEYASLMVDHWRRYRNEILGTQYDIPLTDMFAQYVATGDNNFRLNVYWKGALVAYLMDQRLATKGLNLDIFLRQMYRTYALNQLGFNTHDTITMLNSISGDDWTSFYNQYIYGTTPLPLSGQFTYLQH